MNWITDLEGDLSLQSDRFQLRASITASPARQVLLCVSLTIYKPFEVGTKWILGQANSWAYCESFGSKYYVMRD